MSENEIRRRAALYGALKQVREAVRDEPVRTALYEAFGVPGDGEYISGARKTVTVDEEWLGRCEGALEHFTKAIEQSRSLIKKDGEVVRIDRAKRPSKDSVTHLARHSNLIKSVTDDGRLAPEEIYINENDEDLAVYENRFLYLALTYMQSFVSMRYEQISRAAAEAGVSLYMNRGSRSSGKSISYELKISETSNGAENAADALQQHTVGRIRRVLNAVSGSLQTPLMKSVSSAPKLTPPVVRTNIIKNNVHFAEIYDLYMFLISYEGQGFTVQNDAKNASAVPESAAGVLCDIAALQFFAAYQGAFDGWDDSESLYNEEEEQKSQQLLRKLKYDVEQARAELKSGGITAEEYIELLEKRNAMLADAYEKSEETVSDLRRKDRESHRTVIRLSAEHDMMKDKMKQAEIFAEERIKERAAASEREAEQRADERIRRAEEEYERQKQALTDEKDLLSARLRAEGLLKEEDGAFQDINDRENFIRLEREYRALGQYYKKQWSRAKKRIRAEEWKNRKDTGEGEK